MKSIPVYNPSRNGKRFCTVKRAQDYIRRGRAVLRPDGALEFTMAARTLLEQREAEQVAFEESFKLHRGEVVYWNGAFTDPKNHPGLFAFPPCCNVAFRRPGARYGV